MRRVKAIIGQNVQIGHVGDNGATQVVIDVAEILESFGTDGEFVLQHERHCDEFSYPVVTELDEDEQELLWTVKSGDVARVGYGQLQLHYIIGEQVVYSAIWTTAVKKSLMKTGEAPAPFFGWIQRLIDLVGTGMRAVAHTLPAGSDATASYDDQTRVLSLGIPRGEKGEKGDDYVLTDADKTEIAREASEMVEPYDDTEIRQEIAEKAKLYKLFFDGADIYWSEHDWEEGLDPMTFEQIRALCYEPQNFVYIGDGTSKYYPTIDLDVLTREESIQFIASGMLGGRNYQNRVIINEFNEVKYDQVVDVPIGEFNAMQTKLDEAEQRLKDFVDVSEGIVYDVTADETEAYSKTVPSKGFKASVDMFGGHSEVVDGEIISADVDKVDVRSGDNTLTDSFAIPTAIRNLDGYGWSAGSVYNYVDFERKVFVKRVGRIDLGTLLWRYQPAPYNFGYVDQTSTPSDMAYRSNATIELLCSKYLYKGIGTTSILQTANDYEFFAYCDPSYTRPILRFKNSSLVSASEFRLSVNGVMLYYELATPIETDISSLIPSDFLTDLDTEEGGTITFHQTSTMLPVPSKVEFKTKGDVVKDVKVNGASVVTNGNAEIPIAKKEEFFGLTKTANWFGIRADDNGYLRNYSATSGDILDRTQPFRPIVPANLDYAVKSALTDGKGAAYTAEEQARARERIGASGGKYELIDEMTTTEVKSNITFDVEQNGNPYDFKAIIVLFNFPVTTYTSWLQIQIKTNKSQDYIPFLEISAYLATIGTLGQQGMCKVWDEGGIIEGRYSTARSTNVPTTSQSYPYAYFNNFSSLENAKINGITVQPSQTAPIPVGTQIKIYAVRA